MSRRRNHRTDDNQPEIVKALRKIGAEVYDIGRPVDLLVYFRGKWFPVEVKNPEGLNRLTRDQKQFLETTSGPVPIVESAEGAIEALVNLTR